MDAEPGYPDQLTGDRLDNAPSAFVLEPVVVAAGRADVGLVSRAAARPLLDMVAVGAVRGSPAAGMRAGTVADLGTATQRPSRSARPTLLVRLPLLGGRTIAPPTAVPLAITSSASPPILADLSLLVCPFAPFTLLVELLPVLSTPVVDLTAQVSVHTLASPHAPFTLLVLVEMLALLGTPVVELLGPVGLLTLANLVRLIGTLTLVTGLTLVSPLGPFVLIGLADQVSDDVGPSAEPDWSGGQLAEHGDAHLQLNDAATAW